MVRIYRDRYEQDGCHRCQVFDGVRPMLERLKAAGVRLYTATSKPTVVVTPILHEQGLAGYFDFIGGASEDKSVDTKTAVMRMVLDRPELQGARVLMVGDRKDDMQGAADCGVPASGSDVRLRQRTGGCAFRTGSDGTELPAVGRLHIECGIKRP